jgi:hypothetical protein
MLTVAQHLRHIKPRIQTAADYLAWATRQVQAKGDGSYIHDSATPVNARVDWGRWVIDCTCGTVVMVQPEWTYAPCAECGIVHQAIVYPAERTTVEQLLDVRQQRTQFFDPATETIEMLIAENLAHGLPVPGVLPGGP